MTRCSDGADSFVASAQTGALGRLVRLVSGPAAAAIVLVANSLYAASRVADKGRLVEKRLQV